MRRTKPSTSPIQVIVRGAAAALIEDGGLAICMVLLGDVLHGRAGGNEMVLCEMISLLDLSHTSSRPLRIRITFSDTRPTCSGLCDTHSSVREPLPAELHTRSRRDTHARDANIRL